MQAHPVPLLCRRATPSSFVLALAVACAVPAGADPGPKETWLPPVANAAPEVVIRTGQPRLRVEDLPKAKRFVTQHKTRILGKTIRYKAIAGETFISNLYGEPTASIFSFSYIVDTPAGPDRPVMFVFNGGPGSSSLWLHMGAVGPRRILLDREVNPSNLPPFGYQNNPFSPLDVADLVFVDPVGTGFSHAVGNAKETDFYGVEEDADANARFVEAWLTEHGRWNSPKFLMGESYGATRVAVMSRALAGGPFYGGTLRAITLNGIILVSPSMAIKPTPATGALDMALALPTFAVTAWYHGRVRRDGRNAAQYYEDAKRFAIGDYIDTLENLESGSVAPRHKEEIAARLSEFTGLPAKEWASRNFRIPSTEFRELLLSDQGLEAGAYDGRYTMAKAGGVNDPVADDPAMAKYTPAFVAAFHQMIRNELEVAMARPYNSITWVGANFGWRWNRSAGGPNATPGGDLAMAMRRTPELRVLVASGLYDFAASPAKAERELADAMLPFDRTIYRTYESGHMLYIGQTAEAFAGDVRALIEARPRS